MHRQSQEYERLRAESDEAATEASVTPPACGEEANLCLIGELVPTTSDAARVVRVPAKVVKKKFSERKSPDGDVTKWIVFALRDSSGVLRVVAFGDVAMRLSASFEQGQFVELYARLLSEYPEEYRKGIWRDCKLQAIVDNHDGNVCLVPSDLVAQEDNAPPESSAAGSKKFNRYEALREMDRAWQEKFNEPLKSVILNVDGRVGTGDSPTTYFYDDGVWCTGESKFCSLLAKAGLLYQHTDLYKAMYEHLSTYTYGHPETMVAHMTEMEWTKMQNSLPDACYPFANGVMNLVTGTSRPARPSDYLTQKDTRKMPDTRLWTVDLERTWQYGHVKATLETILPCQGLREEVLWWLGYALMTRLKDGEEKHHMNCYGRKDNAKTAFGAMVKFGFGDIWVKHMDMRKVQTTSHSNPEQARGWLLDLRGARVAIGEEGSKNINGKAGLRDMASDILKMTAGATPITARKLNKEDEPAFLPTYLYLFLTNPPVTVQSEEQADGDRERDLIRRYEFPAWFPQAGEYEAFKANPNAHPDRDPNLVHLRDPTKMRLIVHNEDEEESLLFSLCVMKYITKQYERYLTLQRWTDAWTRPSPALMQQYREELQRAMQSEEPHPPQPKSPSELWQQLSPSQQQCVERELQLKREAEAAFAEEEQEEEKEEEAPDAAFEDFPEEEEEEEVEEFPEEESASGSALPLSPVDEAIEDTAAAILDVAEEESLVGNDLFDFYKRSRGEVASYAEFKALIAPLSTPRETKYRHTHIAEIGGLEGLSLAELVSKLFDITGNIAQEERGRISGDDDWMWASDMLKLVHFNPITLRRHSDATPSAIKQLLNSQIGTRLCYCRIRRAPPHDPDGKKVAAMGFKGLRMSDTVLKLMLDDTKLFSDFETFWKSVEEKEDDDTDALDDAEKEEEAAVLDEAYEAKLLELCRKAVAEDEVFPAGVDHPKFDIDVIRAFSCLIERELKLRRFQPSHTLSLTRLTELVYRSASKDGTVLTNTKHGTLSFADLPLFEQYTTARYYNRNEREVFSMETPDFVKEKMVSEFARVYQPQLKEELERHGYEVDGDLVKGLSEKGVNMPLNSGDRLCEFENSPASSTRNKGKRPAAPKADAPGSSRRRL